MILGHAWRSTTRFFKMPRVSASACAALITILELSSVSALPEWVSIGYSENLGGYTVYVDQTTIRRKGNLVKVWVLTDYATLQTLADLSFLSSKAHNEFDCVGKQQHELAVTWFSDHMGQGNEVWSSSNDTDWRPVASGSVGQGVWKFACGCEIAPCPIQPLT